MRTIACVYTPDELPAPWVQVFRRFKRAMARAGLRVRVRLLPLDDAREGAEIIVVPPHLEQLARAAAPSAVVIATTREGAGEAISALLRDLGEGARLYAEPADPNAPIVIRRRGVDEL